MDRVAICDSDKSMTRDAEGHVVWRDWDGCSGAIAPAGEAKILNRRDFDHRGLTVTEVVARWAEKTRKVVWCLAPFERMVHERDGAEVRNYLFHEDYEVTHDYDVDRAREEAARRAVSAAFEAYHFGAEGADRA